MVYTTTSVKVAKSGIQIGYADANGALSTQNMSFENKTLTLDSGLAIAGGNLSMTGDLSIEGGANFGGAFHVDGAATLASTVAVTGAASLASTLAVAGNANLASGLNVSGASHLVGALTQDGAASFGSTVGVSGALTASSTSDLIGAAHLHNTLLVDGASHLVGAVSVDGAAIMGSSLEVVGGAHLDSTLQVDGAASLGDTLTVAGAATLNSGVTVNGTSAMNGAMTVSGAASVGGALNVTGASSLGSTLDVTGVTYLGSTLEVASTAHLVGAVTADDSVSVGTTLSVAGAASLAGALDVTGRTHLVDEVVTNSSVSVGTTLQVMGATTLQSGLSGMSATFQGPLEGFGATQLHNTLQVDGTSQFVGAMTANAGVSVGGALSVSGASSLGSSLAVTGAAHLSSTLDVTGASHLDSTLLVDGAASLGSTLAVTGAATMASTLNVSGAATFQNNVTVNGNLSVLGTQTSIQTTSMEVKDNAILIADGNVSDAVESGIMMQYKPSGSADVKYAGVKRLPDSGEFVFFKDAASKIAEPAAAAAPSGTTIVGDWVQFDYGSAVTVNQANYGPGNILAPKHMYLVGSNDLTTWVQIHHKTSPSRERVLFPSVTFRYFRCIITNIAQNMNTSPDAFEFYLAFALFNNPTHITSIYDMNDIVGWPNQPYGGLSQIITSTSAGFQLPYGISDPNISTIKPSSSVYSDVNNIDNWLSILQYNGNLSTVVYPEGYIPPPPVPADIYATILADGFTCASDVNLKKDIVALDGALDKLDQIRGVYYSWKDENKSHDRQVGVIAQEIQAVYPELVQESGEHHLTVDYPKLTAVLIQSVKELKALVKSLAEKQ